MLAERAQSARYLHPSGVDVSRPMKSDPIVEQVRKNRERVFARFGYDLHRYVESLRARGTKGKAPRTATKAAKPKARRAQRTTKRRAA
jgi:hypothetical protein